MFLPLCCLENLHLKASFSELESSIERIIRHLAQEVRDDSYELLWELGSNVLKHGKLESTIHLKALKYPKYTEITLHYLTGKNLTNICPICQHSPNNTNAAMLHILRFDTLHPSCRDFAKLNFAKRDFMQFDSMRESNLLGNKVIAFLANKICYDMPKILLLNAKERVLKVRLKSALLAK